jgi:hypothetical protein
MTTAFPLKLLARFLLVTCLQDEDNGVEIFFFSLFVMGVLDGFVDLL